MMAIIKDKVIYITERQFLLPSPETESLEITEAGLLHA